MQESVQTPDPEQAPEQGQEQGQEQEQEQGQEQGQEQEQEQGQGQGQELVQELVQEPEPRLSARRVGNSPALLLPWNRSLRRCRTPAPWPGSETRVCNAPLFLFPGKIRK